MLIFQKWFYAELMDGCQMTDAKGQDTIDITFEVQRFIFLSGSNGEAEVLSLP